MPGSMAGNSPLRESGSRVQATEQSLSDPRGAGLSNRARRIRTTEPRVHGHKTEAVETQRFVACRRLRVMEGSSPFHAIGNHADRDDTPETT